MASSNSTHPFSAVFSALAGLYEAETDAQRATLKARINHLQRLQVIGASPGKGRALQYQMDHVWRWVFCLELAEFGVAPATAAALVARYWDSHIARIFRKAQRAVRTGKDPVFLCIRGAGLMSAAWRLESDQFADVPHLGEFTPGSADVVLGWLTSEEERVPPRISIVNLSARLRVLLGGLEKHEHFAG